MGSTRFRNLAFLSGIAQSPRVQVISTLCRVFLAIVLAGWLPACRTLTSKDGVSAKEEEAPVDTPKPASVTLPVGVIHHVDATAGFVLIRSSRALQIEPGTQLTVYGDQGAPSATLEVSPARKGSFLTADIVQGSPQKGQQITMDFTPPAPLEAGAPVTGPADPNAIQVLE